MEMREIELTAWGPHGIPTETAHATSLGHAVDGIEMITGIGPKFRFENTK